MKWQACFEQYFYNPLIETDLTGERKLDIDIFLQNGQVPDELQQVYISKYKDEMFLVFRVCKNINIAEFCDRWDNKILTFINFGYLPVNDCQVKNIEYNITQIVLCGEALDKELEKSTSVSRKLIIMCDENDELDNESQLVLPFWYEKLEGVQTEQEQKDELNKLLPLEAKLDFMRKVRPKIDKRKSDFSEGDLNFSKEENDAVKGWLETDDIGSDND